MDENKLEKLKEINYTVKRVCANCAYLNRNNNLFSLSIFSTCQLHQYDHKKHTGPARQLTVHTTGSCESHQWGGSVVDYMHAFAQFTEE